MKNPTPIAGGFVVALLVGIALSVSGCTCCGGSCGSKGKPAAAAQTCPADCSKPCCAPEAP